MRPEAHLTVAEAEVRGHSLRRHVARKLDRGRVFVIAGGMGLPRTWGMLLEAALAGFEEGLALANGEGAERLEQAAAAAHERLSRTCAATVERLTCDASLLALAVDGAHLHVLTAGPGRAYLHRRGHARRLTPREDPPEGLLRATPVRCSADLEPGDLVLAGSVSAFSSKAIARLSSVLEADPRTAPSVLGSLLTEPAARAGVGAAAVALRIR